MPPSTIDASLPAPIRPFFPADDATTSESPATKTIISTLGLQEHIEGGYFVETDRDSWRIPNPFLPASSSSTTDSTRNASTTIYYFLTPTSPQGAFHRNKGRTVHTLHSGRGRYVLIHADEVSDGIDAEGTEKWKGKARVETFIVGHDVSKGERLQWIVDGGKYKASFLLPDEDDDGTDATTSKGLLISETVVPGFEFTDHDFMPAARLHDLVSPAQAEELLWLIRK
ncbi:MAG: hypothetical protein M1819_003012 [Sarea resinae]|nr:MAG: hypothetical protein M1819_003012 [Sarea resinae]